MKQPAKVSAQEYADIQNLYAYYNLCSDRGDAEGYASCFSEDGELLIEPRGLSVKGGTALAAYKRRDAESRNGKYRRHWNGSIHLEKLAPGRVRGRCYLQAFNGQPGALPELDGVAVYEDMIIRVRGAWKFARRHLTIDGSARGGKDS